MRRNTGIIFFYIDFKPKCRFFQMSSKFPRKKVVYNSEYQLQPKNVLRHELQGFKTENPNALFAYNHCLFSHL